MGLWKHDELGWICRHGCFRDDFLVSHLSRFDFARGVALETNPKKMSKVFLFGLTGSVSLLGFYLVVMSLGSGSLDFAVSELVRLKYWVSALVLGFGVQIGLFSYLKACGKMGSREKGMMAGSSTTSAVAMVACCAHHLTDVLPLIGLSLAATFLARYQEWFLAAGIVSNLFGVGFMIRNLMILKKT